MCRGGHVFVLVPLSLFALLKCPFVLHANKLSEVLKKSYRYSGFYLPTSSLLTSKTYCLAVKLRRMILPAIDPTLSTFGQRQFAFRSARCATFSQGFSLLQLTISAKARSREKSTCAHLQYASVFVHNCLHFFPFLEFPAV